MAKTVHLLRSIKLPENPKYLPFSCTSLLFYLILKSLSKNENFKKNYSMSYKVYKRKKISFAKFVFAALLLQLYNSFFFSVLVTLDFCHNNKLLIKDIKKYFVNTISILKSEVQSNPNKNLEFTRMMNGKSEGRVEEAGFALLPAAPASICFDKVNHKDFGSLM